LAKIIAVHSFRGGTGKSNLAANMAVVMAKEGMRVGIVDTDIQSPGIHILFGLDGDQVKYSLNDFLWGKCDIEDTVYNVYPEKESQEPGRVYLIPSSLKACDIARVLQYGYDVHLLREGFLAVINSLPLECLIIDTHPGLNEETLLSIAVSDVLLIVLRPDRQDYQGTGVTVEVSRQLEVPEMLMVVNKVPDFYNTAEIIDKVGKAYYCKVAAVIPHSDDMMALASSGIFVDQRPEHPVSFAMSEIVKKVRHI